MARKASAASEPPESTERGSGGSSKEGQPGGRSGQDAAWRVSQLAAHIDRALQDGLPSRVRVVGELSGVRHRTHWYFDLKDADAVINGVLFASAAKRQQFQLRDGLEVVVTGRVDYYAKGGRISLVADKVEPVGQGALELEFRRLCEQLRELGWFDPARKRPLPTFPQRVAVITSRSGAALQDVIDTVRRRCPAVGLVLVDVPVQGEGAAPKIAKAIRAVGRHAGSLGIEAVLVTRGGGSMEDLWAFNERVVGQAILDCPVPVVAAIGHETDTTIAELVADERCATPTQAAMRLTPDRAALHRQLDSLLSRAERALERRVREGGDRLDRAARRPVLADPRSMVRAGADRVDADAHRLERAIAYRLGSEAHRLERLAGRLGRHRPEAAQARREERVRSAVQRMRVALRSRLERVDLDAASRRLQRAQQVHQRAASTRAESLAKRLESVGPAAVLRRGYSWTLDSEGRLVRSAMEVRPGQRVRTRLHDGEFESVVEPERADAGPAPRHETESGPPPSQGPPPPRRKRRTGQREADQPGLFDAGSDA